MDLQAKLKEKQEIFEKIKSDIAFIGGQIEVLKELIKEQEQPK